VRSINVHSRQLVQRLPFAALLRLPTVRVRVRGFFTALLRPTPDGPASALTLASSSSTSMPIATSAPHKCSLRPSHTE